MNNFFKKCLAVSLLVVACSGFVGIENAPVFSSAFPGMTAQAATIMPRAPIIEWRYKVVNDKLYRRQYNCSTQEWIGEWELIP